MLSYKKIGSSAQAISYYETLGKEDYYVGGTEPPGTWWGSGVESLGLSEGSKVDGKSFRNLLTGMSVGGEQKLVQNAGSDTRLSAIDLTWSVPKSVSVAWSQASFERRLEMEAASERALHKVLSKVEELCGVTRRGKAGERVEKAGLVGAVFRHHTSRGVPGETPDPNLHYHLVLCNTVVREDKSTGSLDAREIFRKHMKMALGGMFRAELSKELEGMGLYSHRPERNERKASWFELSAVPRKLVEEFSKRRREVEKWLRKKGLLGMGAKLAEKAALVTRKEKEAITYEELFEKWGEVAAEHGFTKEQLEACFGAKVPARDTEQESREAISEALKIITDQRAHFTKLELLRYMAEAAQGRGIGIDEITKGVEGALQDEKLVVEIADGEEKRFTTPQMLAIEKRMLGAAKRLDNNRGHRVAPKIINKVLGKYESLRAEQVGAVRHIVGGPGSVACVNGMAGTGKTFMLQIAREAWERAGFQVIGTALAAKAAKGLEEGSGIKSTHIHLLLRDIEQGKIKLTKNCALVIDESSLVGTKLLEKLVSLVERSGAKLVMVGDHKQLQAIEAGSPFRGIAERVGYCEMTDIVRQREAWAREAVTEFASGDAHSALRRHHERGLLDIADDREESMSRVARDWTEASKKLDPKEMLIFVGTRLEASSVNRLCQEERRKLGDISEESITCGEEEFHVGDRVLFTRNNKALFVQNGSMGTVVGLEGDTLSIKLDEGVVVRINVETYEHLKLGYAITTHKGQGVTTEKAFMLAGGEMTDRELSYVQGSRARGETKIYTDRLSGGESIEELAKQMNRSNSKDLAHDYLLERT